MTPIPTDVCNEINELVLLAKMIQRDLHIISERVKRLEEVVRQHQESNE